MSLIALIVSLIEWPIDLLCDWLMLADGEATVDWWPECWAWLGWCLPGWLQTFCHRSFHSGHTGIPPRHLQLLQCQSGFICYLNRQFLYLLLPTLLLANTALFHLRRVNKSTMTISTAGFSPSYFIDKVGLEGVNLNSIYIHVSSTWDQMMKKERMFRYFQAKQIVKSIHLRLRLCH